MTSPSRSSAAPSPARRCGAAAACHGARQQAEALFRQAETGAFAGDADVAGQRQFQAGAQRVAPYGGDDGAAQAVEEGRTSRGEDAFPSRDVGCRSGLRAPKRPRAAAERLVFAAKDDDARVLVRRLWPQPRRPAPRRSGVIQRVPLLYASQPHAGDVSLLLQEQIAVRHRGPREDAMPCHRKASES